MINFVETLLGGWVGRGIRATVATAIAAFVAKHQGNEWYLALSPFIQLVFKHLRDKYPGIIEWLPL